MTWWHEWLYSLFVHPSTLQEGGLPRNWRYRNNGLKRLFDWNERQGQSFVGKLDENKLYVDLTLKCNSVWLITWIVHCSCTIFGLWTRCRSVFAKYWLKFLIQLGRQNVRQFDTNAKTLFSGRLSTCYWPDKH